MLQYMKPSYKCLTVTSNIIQARERQLFFLRKIGNNYLPLVFTRSLERLIDSSFNLPQVRYFHKHYSRPPLIKNIL